MCSSTTGRIDEVAAGRATVGPFIQDVVPMTDADRISRALRDGPDTLFGTVFVW